MIMKSVTNIQENANVHCFKTKFREVLLVSSENVRFTHSNFVTSFLKSIVTIGIWLSRFFTLFPSFTQETKWLSDSNDACRK